MSKLAGCLMALSLTFLIAGCGGGGGGVAEPPDVPIEPKAEDVLKAAGLTVTWNCDKDTYHKGETARLVLSIQNDSSKAHTVAVHCVREGSSTYDITIYDDGISGLVRTAYRYGTPSCEVKPGQTVTLLEDQWDLTDHAGVAVSSGRYWIGVYVDRVWLDGKQTTIEPLSTRRSIVVQ